MASGSMRNIGKRASSFAMITAPVAAHAVERIAVYRRWRWGSSPVGSKIAMAVTGNELDAAGVDRQKGTHRIGRRAGTRLKRLQIFHRA